MEAAPRGLREREAVREYTGWNCWAVCDEGLKASKARVVRRAEFVRAEVPGVEGSA